MIIWIDGTYGVGKTSVARELRDRLILSDDVELLEADVYYRNRLKRLVDEAKRTSVFPLFGGTLPQNNLEFIYEFKKIIDEKIESSNKKIIIDMALTREESKKILFENYVNNFQKVVHIVLTAKEEIIQQRIRNDVARDKQIALENLHDNMCFLEKNYQDAIRINTENKSIESIVDEIMKVV